MKSSTFKLPRILVCQHGARHRYAIPRMLEEAGMLAGLYTDSSEYSFLGKYAKKMGKLAPSSLRCLSYRRIMGVPLQKIYSTDYPIIKRLLLSHLFPKPNCLTLAKKEGDILSARMISKGFCGASWIYVMNRANLMFMKYAKARGIKICVDVIISPITDLIMIDEYEKYPDWAVKLDTAEIELGQRLWNETAKMADILLCPSEWVAYGVRSLLPREAFKIRIVPYGCSINYQGRINNPIEGRVLFAGEGALRKGLHYLGQAVSNLKPKIPILDVRIAGSIPENIVNHKICKDLHFLGKLNSNQMMEEYLSADVFILPSLSEGFAGVVAEAIAAGCPAIVTKEAGSPVQHGREGIIIPSRNIDALVNSIKRIVCDRSLRASLSNACLQQVPFYSEEQWKERLISVFK